MTSASAPTSSPRKPDHGRRPRSDAYKPAFSVLRASFAVRLIIATGLSALLWVAVIWVTP